jgi:glycine cleavage system H protein
MSDELTFMMGQFPARIPTDRNYVATHFWLQAIEPELYRVGFTAYAVRLLQDVYFLDWSISDGTMVGKKAEIGEIESSKALSTMYSAEAGEIVRINPVVAADPSAINADSYWEGWLYELRTNSSLLSAAEYMDVLAASWEKTQAIIKGQMNQ